MLSDAVEDSNGNYEKFLTDISIVVNETWGNLVRIAVTDRDCLGVDRINFYIIYAMHQLTAIEHVAKPYFEQVKHYIQLLDSKRGDSLTDELLRARLTSILEKLGLYYDFLGEKEIAHHAESIKSLLFKRINEALAKRKLEGYLSFSKLFDDVLREGPLKTLGIKKDNSLVNMKEIQSAFVKQMKKKRAERPDGSEAGHQYKEQTVQFKRRMITAFLLMNDYVIGMYYKQLDKKAGSPLFCKSTTPPVASPLQQGSLVTRIYGAVVASTLTVSKALVYRQDEWNKVVDEKLSQQLQSQARDLAGFITGTEWTYYFAVIDDEVVGYVDAQRKGDILVIDYPYVKLGEQYRFKGTGTKLVQEAIRRENEARRISGQQNYRRIETTTPIRDSEGFWRKIVSHQAIGGNTGFIIEESEKMFGEEQLVLKGVYWELNRILLAEDEPIVRQVITRMLERIGYEVIAAEDGIDALRKLEAENFNFNLIITDKTMPNMGGVEFLERLKEVNIPKVMLSAEIEDDKVNEVELMARQAGAKIVLAKPIRLNNLENALWQVLYVNSASSSIRVARLLAAAKVALPQELRNKIKTLHTENRFSSSPLKTSVVGEKNLMSKLSSVVNEIKLSFKAAALVTKDRWVGRFIKIKSLLQGKDNVGASIAGFTHNVKNNITNIVLKHAGLLGIIYSIAGFFGFIKVAVEFSIAKGAFLGLANGAIWIIAGLIFVIPLVKSIMVLKGKQDASEHLKFLGRHCAFVFATFLAMFEGLIRFAPWISSQVLALSLAAISIAGFITNRFIKKPALGFVSGAIGLIGLALSFPHLLGYTTALREIIIPVVIKSLTVPVIVFGVLSVIGILLNIKFHEKDIRWLRTATKLALLATFVSAIAFGAAQAIVSNNTKFFFIAFGLATIALTAYLRKGYIVTAIRLSKLSKEDLLNEINKEYLGLENAKIVTYSRAKLHSILLRIYMLKANLSEKDEGVDVNQTVRAALASNGGFLFAGIAGEIAQAGKDTLKLTDSITYGLPRWVKLVYNVLILPATFVYFVGKVAIEFFTSYMMRNYNKVEKIRGAQELHKIAAKHNINEEKLNDYLGMDKPYTRWDYVKDAKNAFALAHSLFEGLLRLAWGRIFIGLVGWYFAGPIALALVGLFPSLFAGDCSFLKFIYDLLPAGVGTFLAQHAQPNWYNLIRIYVLNLVLAGMILKGIVVNISSTMNIREAKLGRANYAWIIPLSAGLYIISTLFFPAISLAFHVVLPAGVAVVLGMAISSIATSIVATKAKLNKNSALFSITNHLLAAQVGFWISFMGLAIIGVEIGSAVALANLFGGIIGEIILSWESHNGVINLGEDIISGFEISVERGVKKISGADIKLNLAGRLYNLFVKGQDYHDAAAAMAAFGKVNEDTLKFAREYREAAEKMKKGTQDAEQFLGMMQSQLFSLKESRLKVNAKDIQANAEVLKGVLIEVLGAKNLTGVERFNNVETLLNLFRAKEGLRNSGNITERESALLAVRYLERLDEEIQYKERMLKVIHEDLERREKQQSQAQNEQAGNNLEFQKESILLNIKDISRRIFILKSVGKNTQEADKTIENINAAMAKILDAGALKDIENKLGELAKTVAAIEIELAHKDSQEKFAKLTQENISSTDEKYLSASRRLLELSLKSSGITKNEKVLIEEEIRKIDAFLNMEAKIKHWNNYDNLQARIFASRERKTARLTASIAYLNYFKYSYDTSYMTPRGLLAKEVQELLLNPAPEAINEMVSKLQKELMLLADNQAMPAQQEQLPVPQNYKQEEKKKVEMSKVQEKIGPEIGLHKEGNIGPVLNGAIRHFDNLGKFVRGPPRSAKETIFGLVLWLNTLISPFPAPAYAQSVSILPQLMPYEYVETEKQKEEFSFAVRRALEQNAKDKKLTDHKPAASVEPQPAVEAKKIKYTVKSGDFLSKISK
ncbi:MAG: response regulator, partial [Candidatus Omnitrophota bacterium]